MMDLKEPKRKRVGPHIKPQQPFPILIESESDIPVERELWPWYIGRFTGDSVVVCDPEEISSLYTMGFFGKGSYSRGYPSLCLSKKNLPPVIKERQWKRRKLWMENMKENIASSIKLQLTGSSESDKPESFDSKIQSINGLKRIETESIEQRSEDGECGSENINTNNLAMSKQGEKEEEKFSDLSSKVLVLADSDDEDLEKVIRDPQPHLEDEPVKTVVETLILTLEEAFFLSFALGCLIVVDILGQSMSLEQLWQTFCKVSPSFIESYVTYHYFRAKGWVVKSGFKFGGDFLLYKQGPAFYHASYVILVEKVDAKLQRKNNTLTWTKLHGLNRLAEGSGKNIIISQVVFPENLTAEQLESPVILTKFQVNEILIKRWISSQEREEGGLKQE